MGERKPIQLTPEQLELATQLTPLQRKYVIALVSSNMSQREAYVHAGGKAKSVDAQDQSASRMLRQVKVKAFYESLLNSAATSAVMSREEALERLSKSARIKITDICTFKLVELKGPDDKVILNTVWEMKNAEDIDPDVAACIKSVTFTKTGPKIELYDANGSIKLLSDMQGWNAPKKTELTGKDGQALAINADVSSPEVAAALAGLMEKL